MYLWFIVIKSPYSIDNQIDTLNFRLKMENYFKDKHCLLSFEKPNTNPHFHILLSTLNKMESVRKSLKLYFCELGKNTIEMTTCEDKYKASVYITKELDIIHNSLYNPDELSEIISTTKKINLDKEKKMTFLQIVIRDYIPLKGYNPPKDLNKHVNDYVCDNLQINNPFRAGLYTSVFEGIIYTHYREHFKKKNYIHYFDEY